MTNTRTDQRHYSMSNAGTRVADEEGITNDKQPNGFT